MKITLRREKIIESGEVKVIQELNITRLIDMIDHKKVIALTKELITITLWEGAAYDSIGQWTDKDVSDRIKSLYD
jgi:hypothetical protein